MAMVKQSCVITAFVLVISLLCLSISTESRTVAVEGKQVRPLSVEMANNMPAKLLSQNNELNVYKARNEDQMEPLNLKNTTASSFLPEKVYENGAAWCIVKPSAGQVALDQIIQYCCTQSGVDCRVINLGGACYNPSNKASDASVVMNTYYKVNGQNPHNCYFNGYGLIVNQDPSVGGCRYKA